MAEDSRALQTVSLAELSGRKGTYVLILELAAPCKIVVGGLGAISFHGGHYAYVGSARGPGGLRARVRRHLSRPKKKRWHIDFLLERARPREVMVFLSGIEEVSLATSLKSFLQPVRGFGASDDPLSHSHLFYLGDESFEAVRRIVELTSAIPGCRRLTLEAPNSGRRPPVKRSM